MIRSDFKQLSVGAIGIAGFAFATGGLAGDLTKYTAPPISAASDARIDYKNAKAMPFPLANSAAGTAAASSAATVAYPGAPGAVSGQPGTGQLNPKVLAPSSGLLDSMIDEIVPQEFGTSNRPFTTSRVDVNLYPVSRSYPYAPAGKLFFNIGTSTYVCSASLIKKGLVVTAAHCVAAFGQRRFYTNWRFVPAYSNGVAPYGSWTAKGAWIKTSYYDGTDPCWSSARGVVCQNDVAVITLNAQSGRYPGTATGFYGYGWNGFGFTPTRLAQITQLGYPVSHDGGNREQRTESQGTPNATYAGNTLIGSRQTGGSSGGPWLVNLGVPATLSGTGYGSAFNWNTVVGVTSWGWTNTAIKELGASPFLSTNIVSLVNSACSGFTGC